MFSLLGGRFGLSRRADIPRWMKSKAFRYGFLGFFLLMFFQMLWSTYLVFAGAQELRQAVTLLWTFRLPWHWAYYGTLFSPGVAQFAFGFYSVMLTSTVLGLVTMVLFKPRSWCVYCPMGTMTQPYLPGKHRGEAGLHSPAQGQLTFPSVPYTIKYRSPTEVHMVDDGWGERGTPPPPKGQRSDLSGRRTGPGRGSGKRTAVRADGGKTLRQPNRGAWQHCHALF